MKKCTCENSKDVMVCNYKYDCDKNQVFKPIGKERIKGKPKANVIKSVWKDASKNPPSESGRYWCNVIEVNDLGISYYQWNCAYSKEDNRWSSSAMSKNVTHWTELLPRPQVSH